MWIERLGCHADHYTVSRCHTRGESEHYTGDKAGKRDPPWLWNPGQTSPEVQNKGISGSTPQKIVMRHQLRKFCLVCKRWVSFRNLGSVRIFGRKFSTNFEECKISQTTIKNILPPNLNFLNLRQGDQERWFWMQGVGSVICAMEMQGVGSVISAMVCR